MVVLTAPAGERIGRELAAMALLAITAFASLSLVSAEISTSGPICAVRWAGQFRTISPAISAMADFILLDVHCRRRIGGLVRPPDGATWRASARAD